MLLKITRSQHLGGIISKNTVFCIDARVQFTPQENQNITRYKLRSEVIYDSEAFKRMAARSDQSRGRGMEYSDDIGSMASSAMSNAFSGAKSLAFAALAAMKLRITIGSLERGQRVECKDLNELSSAEDAIMQACSNLKHYLDQAETFDGGEVLYDYATGFPVVVASSSPKQMLILPPEPSAASSVPDTAPHASHERSPQPTWVSEDEQFETPPNASKLAGAPVRSGASSEREYQGDDPFERFVYRLEKFVKTPPLNVFALIAILLLFGYVVG